MKLYRHYKNQFYEYVGQAKHSETLEDMVIYKTRYESPGGRDWIRPKKMFFETVDTNGELTQRFQEVPLNIQATTEVTDKDLDRIAPLIALCFKDWDPKWFDSTLSNHNKFYLSIACVEEQVVGFKLGYEHNQADFYSWLGAVHPDFRGLGIATELMHNQHKWCRQQGYQKILTKTQNRFRQMLMLNLSQGFDVVGMDTSAKHGLKILLEKIL